MSRAGYSDDYDQWALIKWRGQVASAIRGKRGQAFIMELLDALEAMPERRLIANTLSRSAPVYGPPEGPVGVCAIGSVGVRRGLDMSDLDPDDYDHVADTFGIAHQLVQEIEYENDEAGDWYGKRTPEQRWQHMHDWAMKQLRPVPIDPA